MFEYLIVVYLVGCAITLGFSIKMIVEVFSKGVPEGYSYFEHIVVGFLAIVFLLIVPVFSWISLGYILSSLLVSIEEKLGFIVRKSLESKEVLDVENK